MNVDTMTGPPITTSGSGDRDTVHAAPNPAEARPFESFAAGLLRSEGRRGWEREARRLGTGLGLAALFGAALGLRVGGLAIPLHAVGVAAGLLVVAGVAAPSFAIVLALVDAPIDSQALASATSSAVARAGLVLGGLAPAAALYVVTVEDAITVTVVGLASLVLSGAIAAASFSTDVQGPVRAASPETRRWMKLAMPAFLLLATALALRVWWLALPVLGGAS